MRKSKRDTRKGFTLIEVLVSTFIFVIIVSGVIIIFSRQSASFNHLREQHRNIENAQFALNYMAKILRTSGVAAVTDGVSSVPNSGQTLYVYNFSQPESCFRFSTRGGTISVTQATPNGRSVPSCMEDSRYDVDDEVDLTTGFVSGFFVARETLREDPDTAINEMQMGLITMSLRVQDSATSSGKPTVLQTSVSLRDYPGEISF